MLLMDLLSVSCLFYCFCCVFLLYDCFFLWFPIYGKITEQSVVQLLIRCLIDKSYDTPCNFGIPLSSLECQDCLCLLKSNGLS